MKQPSKRTHDHATTFTEPSQDVPVVETTDLLVAGAGPAGAGRRDQLPFTLHAGKARKEWILTQLRRGGHDPSYSQPTLFLVRDGSMIMMANHQYGYRQPDAQVLTDATIAGRAENLAIVNALRCLGGPWKHLELMTQSAFIGVRESRRPGRSRGNRGRRCAPAGTGSGQPPVRRRQK